jgi:hypothetical protein
MFSKEEISKRVNQLNWIQSETSSGKINNTIFILSEIQKFIYSRVDGSKCRDCHPSNFIKQCVLEDWKYATAIADPLNKELLGDDFYQDFVRDVKNSSDFISMVRNIKLESLKIS